MNHIQHINLKTFHCLDFLSGLLQWATGHRLTRKLLVFPSGSVKSGTRLHCTMSKHGERKYDWWADCRHGGSMTSDLNLKIHPRKHKCPFLHLFWPNVGQIWQWQSCQSSQIYSTWETKGYKWLRDCGEITLWKKDQEWTSLVFYRLTERE